MNRADYLRRRYLMLTGQLPEQKQVGPEGISAILAGMGGQEDRLEALVKADRVPAKDITTVIKKSEDPDTPTTETITIKGGLLGERDWDGSAAFADRDVGMGGGGQFVGLGDPRNVRAGPDLPTGYAPNPAYAPPGSSPSMRAVYPPIPNQVPAASNVHRRQGAGDRRFEEFVPPNVNTMPPGINYPPQASGALPPSDPRFGPMKKDIFQKGMIDPTWEGDTSINTPRIHPRVIARAQEERGEYAQNELDRMTPPPPWASTIPIDHGQDDEAGQPRGSSDYIIRGQLNQAFPKPELERRKHAQQELDRMTPPFNPEQQIVEPEGSLPSGKMTKPRFRGEGEAGSDVSMSGTTTEEGNKREMDANPKLEKIWGRYAYDPAARRKFYLDQLKDIWRKAMLMDVVANLTGGKSMSSRYIQMATGRLDATDKFNEEERISNIWKEVFSDAEGNFYMPKTKREAAERAARTGAQPKLISSIFGSVPETKKKDQYFRVNPNDKTQWEIIRPDEDPGKGWVRGTPTARAPLSDKDIYMERFEDWQELEKTNPELAKAYGRMIGAVEKDPKGVSPSRWTSILQGDIQGSDPTIQLPEGETATSFIMKWLTQPEVEYVDPISGDAKKMPGYSGLTGQTATEAEIAEATGATTATGDVTVDTSGEETREEYEARVRKRYPNASEEDIQATVRAKYG